MLEGEGEERRRREEKKRQKKGETIKGSSLTNPTEDSCATFSCPPPSMACSILSVRQEEASHKSSSSSLCVL